MTAKRRDSHSTEFGLWLREKKEIDSSLGYIATNIDYLWCNYKTGQWMLLEEKRHGSKCKRWQKDLFKKIHKVAKSDESYYGFHAIYFQNTSPEDGYIFFDEININKEMLIKILQFDFDEINDLKRIKKRMEV